MISKLELPIFKKKKIDIKEENSVGSNTHNTAIFHKYSPRFFIRFSFVLRCFHDEVVSKPTVLKLVNAKFWKTDFVT